MFCCKYCKYLMYVHTRLRHSQTLNATLHQHLIARSFPTFASFLFSVLFSYAYSIFKWHHFLPTFLIIIACILYTLYTRCRLQQIILTRCSSLPLLIFLFLFLFLLYLLCMYDGCNYKFYLNRARGITIIFYFTFCR